jgi:hypothetical protein
MSRIRWSVGIVASVVPSVLVLAVAQPVGAGTAHSGWIAHSAYGLQLSVPSSWSVRVFGQCPDGQRPGTLFIGTTQFVDSCPAYGSNTTQVDLYKADALSVVLPRSHRTLRVHGLSVLSSKTGTGNLWIILSRTVIVTGSGPKALSIMETLALATRHATPATGVVNGTEYSESLQQLPVSGPVTVTVPASGKTVTVDAIDGQFSFSGAPGRYILTGRGGNVACPPVSVTVVSGERINAPPIQCQGD